jgi:phenylpyruvate tautomerase PptA (4-oxalocrotonate tautomerase family)
MPTIDIQTPPLTVPARRAVAVRLTRWLKGRGIEARRVVVRFSDSEPGRLFSGGLPVEALPHDGAGPQHASVTVCVGPTRDEEFRAALAEEIAAALGTTGTTPFLYIEFRPTDPALVHLGDPDGLRRADRPRLERQDTA